MKARSFNPIPQIDRFSYLWLLIGVVLSIFVTGRYAVGFIVWLAPVFLMRFVRTQSVKKGFLLVAAGSIVTSIIGWKGIMPIPFPGDVITLAMMGTMGTLVLIVDRMLVARWQRSGRNPFATTLIYPALVTSFEFLTLEGNPMGSFGASAYTQHGNLVLLQMLSVTGMWGITFLMGWFPAVVNWAWEHQFQWTAIRRGTAVYAGIMLAIVLFGVGRLVLAPDVDESGTVQVAGVTAVPLDMGYLNSLPQDEMRQELAAMQDAYFTASIPLAEQGADLILWPEAAAVFFADDEDAVMTRAADFATEHDVYLAVPVIRMHQTDDRYENELRIVAPNGNTILTHRKYGGRQFEVGSVPGDGVLRTAVTPIGTLSGVICWDTDFPTTVSQAGRNGTTLLLSPSKDDILQDAANMHSEMASFRAIENGVTVFRQSDYGFSTVIDPYGRVLAETPFNANGTTNVSAAVSTESVPTLYSNLGNLFGLAAVIGFVLLAGWAIIAGRKTAVSQPTESDLVTS